MKKILLFLFIAAAFSAYSNCKYIADPNIHERSIIKLIRKYKLDDKIYCTKDGEKLAYRTGDFGEYMQIGIVYRFKDIDDFGNKISSAMIDFDKNRDKLLPNNLSVVDKIGMSILHFKPLLFYNYNKCLIFFLKLFII